MLGISAGEFELLLFIMVYIFQELKRIDYIMQGVEGSLNGRPCEHVSESVGAHLLVREFGKCSANVKSEAE